MGECGQVEVAVGREMFPMEGTVCTEAEAGECRF